MGKKIAAGLEEGGNAGGKALMAVLLAQLGVLTTAFVAWLVFLIDDYQKRHSDSSSV